MNDTTKMLRQVHPNFLQNGRVSSQAFRPTHKDENLLSVYNGDDINPENAFIHYTEVIGKSSCGVLAVTCGECNSCCLPVKRDPTPFKAHCIIDFTGKTTAQRRKLSGVLRDFSIKRGWLYRMTP